MIEYLYQEGVEACSKEPLKVRMDGRICGEIRKVSGGFRYYPKAMKYPGDLYDTVSAVQKSLQE